ncbi:MAG: lactonase family protein [Planctomycetaceae bacterium]|nr:lactonase family protein [Planctomycetaceae bacterium]
MNCRLLLSTVVFSLLVSPAGVSAQESDQSMRVYFGTYTQRESRGIYLSTLDVATGALSPAQLVAESEQPSFVALHPTRPLLYAVNETQEFNGQPGGGVSAFTIDPADGALTELNCEATHGGAPCHLVVDHAGRNVLVANYSGGNVAVLPIREDGSLAPASCVIQHTGSSVNPQRQQEPHAHSINLDASGEFAFVCDLGLDQVLVYRYDAKQGTLSPHEPPSTSTPPGSGPRHFAFHPSGRFAYANLEITSAVQAFRYHPPIAVLYGFQTISTLPEDYPAGNSTAETQVHPSGRFVYCSNRGHDSIAVYRVNEDSGELTFVEHAPTHGQMPRNFGIDPSGTFLIAANQETDNVFVFRIDTESGRLSPTGHSLRVPMPVCVKFAAPH